jgi:N-acetylneuraminic acid mutarotase
MGVRGARRSLTELSLFFLIGVLLLGSASNAIGTYSITVMPPSAASSWAETTRLPLALTRFASVVVGNRIYIIGGQTTTGDVKKTVYFAEIHADGSLGPWAVTTPLPEERFGARAVTYGNWIYVVGGSRASGELIERSQVWYASVSADGTVGNWASTTSIPYAATGHYSFVCNGRIYTFGGWTGYNWVKEVYYSEINSDGSLGPWTSTTPLPQYTREARAVAHGGRVYVLGGYSDNTPRSAVYYADVASDGSIGNWQVTTHLPKNMASHSAVLLENSIYVAGGWSDSGAVSNSVYRGDVKADGLIDSWVELMSLPVPLTDHWSVATSSPVTNSNNVYVLGGWDSTGTIRDEIYVYTTQQATMHESLTTTAVTTISSLTSRLRVYSLPYSYLGRDPASLASFDLHAVVSVDYVLNGQVGDMTETTPFWLEADIGSEISFTVVSVPSGWEFLCIWDHYGYAQHANVCILTIKVVPGIERIAAFFYLPVVTTTTLTTSAIASATLLTSTATNLSTTTSISSQSDGAILTQTAEIATIVAAFVAVLALYLQFFRRSKSVE